MTDKIIKAYAIISSQLKDHISNIEIGFDNDRIKIKLINGILIFIRYNNYNQYSYTIQFSYTKFDRIRYDNYDDLWDISTKPHHCHPRHKHQAIESEYQGAPEADVPKFVIEVKAYLK